MCVCVCVYVCVTERELGVMLNSLELVKENKIPPKNGKQQKANDKYNFFLKKSSFQKVKKNVYVC